MADKAALRDEDGNSTSPRRNVPEIKEVKKWETAKKQPPKDPLDQYLEKEHRRNRCS